MLKLKLKLRPKLVVYANEKALIKQKKMQTF